MSEGCRRDEREFVAVLEAGTAVRRFLALSQAKREAMSVRIRGPILAQAMVMSLRAQTRLEVKREARRDAAAERLAAEAIRRAQLRARRGSFM